MDVNVLLGIFFTHRAIVPIHLRVIQLYMQYIRNYIFFLRQSPFALEVIHLINMVVSGDIRYITYNITHALIPFGFHSAQCDSVTAVKILYYGANT